MKKTLFAMAALALCGTALAGTYNASEWEDFMPGCPYDSEEAVTLNVDASVEFCTFDASEASSLTLNFKDNFSIISDYSELEVGAGVGGGSLSIVGEDKAKTSWATALTSSDITSITLANGNGRFYPPLNASFEGLTESGSITLGDAELTYMGYFTATNMDAAKAHITGDNQIALVAISKNGNPGQLALVGKISSAPATPEPATATLSLLALAGLCARRRRH